MAGYAQLVYTRPPLWPQHHAPRTETLLEILTRHGAPTPAEAMSYAALIDRHIFGSAFQAVEERAMEQRYGLSDAAELAAAITAARDLAAVSGSYPILSSWMGRPSHRQPRRTVPAQPGLPARRHCGPSAPEVTVVEARLLSAGRRDPGRTR